MFEVIDGYTYDEFSEKYTYSVFLKEKRIFHKEEKSSPWVIFNPLRKLPLKMVGVKLWTQCLALRQQIKLLNIC